MFGSRPQRRSSPLRNCDMAHLPNTHAQRFGSRRRTLRFIFDATASQMCGRRFVRRGSRGVATPAAAAPMATCRCGGSQTCICRCCFRHLLVAAAGCCLDDLSLVSSASISCCRHSSLQNGVSPLRASTKRAHRSQKPERRLLLLCQHLLTSMYTS